VKEWANASHDPSADTAANGDPGRPSPYSPNQGRLPDPADPSTPPDLDAGDVFHRVAARDSSDPLEVARGLPLLKTGNTASGETASGETVPGNSPSAATDANGPLLGGNLSVLTRLIGTPAFPDLAGAILVIEDVGEPPYRVDRMLTHLHLAGHLDGLAGVVLGSFRPGDIRPPSLSMAEVFRDRFADRPYPVATGLAYGHLFPRLTLPLGAPARLTRNDNTAALHVTLHRPSV
jgi:muramoyltetrapeptide carboxypeptidase